MKSKCRTRGNSCGPIYPALKRWAIFTRPDGTEVARGECAGGSGWVFLLDAERLGVRPQAERGDESMVTGELPPYANKTDCVV
jgi:hypothetical protein